MELMTVGDAARECGVAVETIRLWERVGKLPPAQRTVGGIRLFRREDVDRVASKRRHRRRKTT